MDAYLLALYVGFGGLLLVTLLGLGHHVTHRAHSPAGGARLHHHRGGHVREGNRSVHFLLMLVSPRLVFSLLLGFGATGVLLRPLAAHWPLFLLPLLAAIDAGVFERYVVQPFCAVLAGFASTPARSLDCLVQTEGQAVMNFDASGQGLIAVDLDGQARQLLGCLPAAELAAGGRVRAGDRLLIQAVDLRRNSCTVSRVD